MAESSRLERISYSLQRLITPGLRYSQSAFEETLQTYVPKATRWLDLGCGHRLLPEWRASAEAELMKSAPFAVGVDADFDAIRRHRSFHQLCLGNISQLPFKVTGIPKQYRVEKFSTHRPDQALHEWV